MSIDLDYETENRLLKSGKDKEKTQYYSSLYS